MAGKTTSRKAADGKVTLTLAHPLTAEQAGRLGAADKDHEVGDDITVTKDFARSVIAAGYAQVDPEDPEAVEGVLGEPGPGAVVAPDEKPKN